MPHPIPVPILTKISSSSDRATPACRSPRAMTFTSLSTVTGQPQVPDSSSRTGYRSQPGMIGGATGMPSRKLTGPGSPIPAPISRPGACASTWSAIAITRPFADLALLALVGQHLAPPVGDGHGDRRRPDVHTEQAQVVGQMHEGRAPPAPAGRRTADLHEPGLHELGHLGG